MTTNALAALPIAFMSDARKRGDDSITRRPVTLMRDSEGPCEVSIPISFVMSHRHARNGDECRQSQNASRNTPDSRRLGCHRTPSAEIRRLDDRVTYETASAPINATG